MKFQIYLLNIGKFLFSITCGLILFTGCSSDDDSAKDTDPEVTDPVIVQSQFTSNAEGWTITGDAQGSYSEASYSPDGGVIDGYIYADDDVQGGVWYFTSPKDYHGKKSDYYGATLEFSLYQKSRRSSQFESDDIIFRNGDLQITYVHKKADYPGEEWTNYKVKISKNYWLKGEYNSGIMATESEIKAVLSNVTQFSIRGEFETGPDTGGLDNVKIIIE